MIDPAHPDYSNTPVSGRRPEFGYRPADPHVPPEVSVVTPFFDPGPVFRETAATVLGQSFQQFEWVIVNDGSTDRDSLEILDEVRHADPRIRVVDHPRNLGVSRARNQGFEAAKAEFVLQLDSDDLLETTALEKLYWCLQSYPHLSFAKGYTVGFGAEAYLWRNGFHSGEEFLRQNMADIMTMTRRSVHAAVGGYDDHNPHGLEDWEFWVRCAAHGYWGDTVPEFLGWYRRRSSHGDRWKNWDGAEREGLFRAELQRRYPHLWQGGFPQLGRDQPAELEPISEPARLVNLLAKDHPRLLMIVPWLTMGGADKFNLDCVTEARRRGWETTIVTTLDGDHGWEAEFARHTPDIFALHRFVRPTGGPGFIRYLIESRRPDVVVVSNSELGYRLLPYIRSRCPGPAYVDFCHMEQPDWKSGGYPAMSALFREQIDLTIAASDHLNRWIRERAGGSDRVETCYLGVDTGLWRPSPEVRAQVRDELQIGRETPVVLFAARLMAQKQPQVLAEVTRRLAGDGHEFVVVVAGDGPDRDRLEAFVDRHGLGDRVRLLGAVSSDRVRSLLQASDVFFLPSTWEGIALALYEAMACGVAVVGAAVGGQTELVTPDTGILLERAGPEEEIRAYTAALAELIEDPTRRAALGAAARQRIVEAFSLDHMGDRLSELMERAGKLATTDPRPAVPFGLGTAAATTAVDHMRLVGVMEDLWHQPAGAQLPVTMPPPSPAGPPLGKRVYGALMTGLGPVYRWAMRHQVRGVWRARTVLRKLLRVD